MEHIRAEFKKTIMASIIGAFLLLAPWAGGANAATVWHASITASYGYDTNQVIAGAAYDATDGFENGYDGRAIIAGSLLTYFSHPEWGLDTEYFWSDIKDSALPKEWVFYTASGYVNQVITIRWELTAAPDTLNLSLVDDTAGTTVDMKAQSSYAYTNASTSPRSFRVQASGSVPVAPAPADSTPPDTSITGGMAANAYINSSSAVISYSGTDDKSAQASLQYSYMLDTAAWSAWSASTSAGLAGLSNGAHTFHVKARDEAGNEDPTPAQVSFTVDTGAPVITLSSGSTVTIAGNSGAQTITISGNVTNAASGVASLSYAISDEYGKINGTGAVTPSSNGDFSFAVDVLARAKRNDRDGRQYTVTITAVNGVGNSSAATVTVVVSRPAKNSNNKKINKRSK